MFHYTTSFRPSLVFVYILRLIGVSLVISVFSWFIVYFKVIPCMPSRYINVNGSGLLVCVADTPMLQSRGLGSTRSLPNGWGMLFVFGDYSRHRFWMKDMNYPIDILWLDDDLYPTEVARGAEPDNYPDVYVPKYANRFILETNAGEVEGEFPSVQLERVD